MRAFTDAPFASAYLLRDWLLRDRLQSVTGCYVAATCSMLLSPMQSSLPTMAVGILLEDQVWPKSCGHVRGKRVVRRAEAVARIQAAVDARDAGDDIVIVARTDARQVRMLSPGCFCLLACALVSSAACLPRRGRTFKLRPRRTRAAFPEKPIL